MFSCAYSSFTCSFIYNICSIYPLTTVKTPSSNDMECCCHFHIESDTAPRHSVPGIQWKNVRSGHFFQHTYSKGPSWFPAIESMGWSGKMLEVVASSNIFKWTLLTGGHSMGIQTDPGDLYFQASLGQLHNSVCWLCSLIRCTHLSYALDWWYCFGTFILDVISYIDYSCHDDTFASVKWTALPWPCKIWQAVTWEPIQLGTLHTKVGQIPTESGTFK